MRAHIESGDVEVKMRCPECDKSWIIPAHKEFRGHWAYKEEDGYCPRCGDDGNIVAERLPKQRKAGDDAWQPDPEVIDELQSKLDENWRQQEQQRKAVGDA